MVRTECVRSHRELRCVTHKAAGLLLHLCLTGTGLALNSSPGVMGCPQKGAFGMRQLSSPFDCLQKNTSAADWLVLSYFCCQGIVSAVIWMGSEDMQDFSVYPCVVTKWTYIPSPTVLKRPNIKDKEINPLR